MMKAEMDARRNQELLEVLRGHKNDIVIWMRRLLHIIVVPGGIDEDPFGYWCLITPEVKKCKKHIVYKSDPTVHAIRGLDYFVSENEIMETFLGSEEWQMKLLDAIPADPHNWKDRYSLQTVLIQLLKNKRNTPTVLIRKDSMSSCSEFELDTETPNPDIITTGKKFNRSEMQYEVSGSEKSYHAAVHKQSPLLKRRKISESPSKHRITKFPSTVVDADKGKSQNQSTTSRLSSPVVVADKRKSQDLSTTSTKLSSPVIAVDKGKSHNKSKSRRTKSSFHPAAANKTKVQYKSKSSTNTNSLSPPESDLEANVVDFLVDNQILRMLHSLDEEFPTGNRDFCDVCNFGGHLYCCDFCPRSYHLKCARLSFEPGYDLPWRCPFCSNRKHEGIRGKADSVVSSILATETATGIPACSSAVFDNSAPPSLKSPSTNILQSSTKQIHPPSLKSPSTNILQSSTKQIHPPYLESPGTNILQSSKKKDKSGIKEIYVCRSCALPCHRGSTSYKNNSTCYPCNCCRCMNEGDIGDDPAPTIHDTESDVVDLTRDSPTEKMVDDSKSYSASDSASNASPPLGQYHSTLRPSLRLFQQVEKGVRQIPIYQQVNKQGPHQMPTSQQVNQYSQLNSSPKAAESHKTPEHVLNYRVCQMCSRRFESTLLRTCTTCKNALYSIFTRSPSDAVVPTIFGCASTNIRSSTVLDITTEFDPHLAAAVLSAHSGMLALRVGYILDEINGLSIPLSIWNKQQLDSLKCIPCPRHTVFSRSHLFESAFWIDSLFGRLTMVLPGDNGWYRGALYAVDQCLNFRIRSSLELAVQRAFSPNELRGFFLFRSYDLPLGRCESPTKTVTFLFVVGSDISDPKCVMLLPGILVTAEEEELLPEITKGHFLDIQSDGFRGELMEKVETSILNRTEFSSKYMGYFSKYCVNKIKSLICSKPDVPSAFVTLQPGFSSHQNSGQAESSNAHQNASRPEMSLQQNAVVAINLAKEFYSRSESLLRESVPSTILI